jgi:putative sterol carrier protein
MKKFIKNSLFPHATSDTLMTQTDTIKEAFKILQERYNNPDFCQQLQDYSKIIKFTFTDLQDPYIIEINKGKINDMSHKTAKTPDITISTNSTIFLDILHKKISPIMAFSTGKLKVNGELADLMKLQKLL